MASDPALKEQILDKLRQHEPHVVHGDDMADIMRKLGVPSDTAQPHGVSKTKFGRALRSLHYKDGLLNIRRPSATSPHAAYEPRPYTVSLRTA